MAAAARSQLIAAGAPFSLPLVDGCVQEQLSDLSCIQAGALNLVGDVLTTRNAAAGSTILLKLTGQAEGRPDAWASSTAYHRCNKLKASQVLSTCKGLLLAAPLSPALLSCCGWLLLSTAA